MGGTVYVADEYLVPLLGCIFSDKKKCWGNHRKGILNTYMYLYLLTYYSTLSCLLNKYIIFEFQECPNWENIDFTSFFKHGFFYVFLWLVIGFQIDGIAKFGIQLSF